jgi:hypothetical protein
MRIIALLSILPLSACAKPAPRIAPEPNCFAPAGFYMAFAGLQEHNCKQAPKETIVFGVEVKPNALACGVHNGTTRDKNGLVTMTALSASPRGLAGRIVIFAPDCHAHYDVVLLRMR